MQEQKQTQQQNQSPRI